MNKATINVIVKILCFSIPMYFIVTYIYKLNLNSNTIENIFLWFFLFLLLINVIISFIIGNSYQKIKKTSKYNRNLDNLLPPQDSCMIVSKKFNFNNFVMTVLLNMHLQGKINICNDKIKIKNLSNLTKIQKLIFEILTNINNIQFEEIKFEEINNNIKSNKNLTKNINNLKSEIYKDLFNKKIFDQKKYENIKKIKLFSMLNLSMLGIELVFIMSINHFKVEHLLLLLFHIITIIIFISAKSNPKNEFKNEKMYSLIVLIFLLIISYVIVGGYKNITLNLLLINLISSLLILTFSNPIILTNKGLQEYYKLKELENFIKDFSNLDDKEIKNVELWEKYLLYATAFGIPKKITNSIPENLINFKLIFENLNIILKDLSH